MRIRDKPCISYRMNIHTQNCPLCNIWFRSMGDRRQHERTLKHQRSLGLLPAKINHICNLCDTVIKGTNSKTRHEQTEKHKGRVRGLPSDYEVYTLLQNQSQTSPQHRRQPNPKSVSAVPTLSWFEIWFGKCSFWYSKIKGLNDFFSQSLSDQKCFESCLRRRLDLMLFNPLIFTFKMDCLWKGLPVTQWIPTLLSIALSCFRRSRPLPWRTFKRRCCCESM